MNLVNNKLEKFMKTDSNVLLKTVFILGVFICMLDTTVINVSLPAISRDFNTQLDHLSWALNAYTIVFASLTIPLTRVADIFGKTTWFIIGILLFGLGSLISGFSLNLEILIMGRIIQSVGAALVFPLSMTLAIETVTVEHRIGIIAALGVTQGLAAAMGPTIGGIITSKLSWQWIFLINLPIVVFILVASYFKFKNILIQKIDKKIDVIGALLSVIMLFTLTLGLTQGRTWHWTSLKVISIFLVAIISFILFIIVERKQQEPMIPLTLFKNVNFSAASIVILLSNLLLVAITVILPTYYVNVQGYTTLDASYMITPITVAIFIMSPIAGFALEKLGARKLIMAGFFLMCIGYIGYATGSLHSVWKSIISASFVGCGYGIITGPITVIAASNFEGASLTASQSVSGVLRQVGGVLAVAIFVTGLYSNLDIATTRSINYSDKVITSWQLPKSISEPILNKTKQSIQKGQLHSKISQSHTGVQNIDYKINRGITNIKRYSKENYVAAFENLYLWSIPVLFVGMGTALLFKKEKI